MSRVSKLRLPLPRSAICGLTVLGCSVGALAQEPPTLQVRAAPGQVELRWPGAWVTPEGATRFPAFEVQASDDLRLWHPAGPRVRGDSVAEVLTVRFDRPAPHEFFRVVGILPAAGQAGLADRGEEVFGFAAQLEAELRSLGQLTPEEFAARYALPNAYLPRITWDPTTAEYWPLFASRLDAAERQVFARNGFVVSQRLGAKSFADAYYNLFKADLPVFVSADALLHAWHRSYLSMIEELEESWFFRTLLEILVNMRLALPHAAEQFGAGPLQESLRDADHFLAVAVGLLQGSAVPGILVPEAQVAETWRHIQGEQLERFELFGRCRMVDFSQFKVRGHYEASVKLGQYFRAMMWLGRMDLRVAGGPFDDGCGPTMASPRELGVALVLHHLLQEAGRFELWLQFDRALQAFVGWTDSMTFAQLEDVLAAANVKSLADLPTVAALEALQAELARGKYGFQQIRSDYFVSPMGAEQMVLPRSFTFAGQKFVPDSWALSQLVYDSILWEEAGQAPQKVMRRIPSCFDVGFSVLGNSQIVPELLARMTDPAGRRFRDGLPYQHNLAAVRDVIDNQNAAVWDTSIYTHWLAVLRELSRPTTAPAYPEAMRTHAWAMKTLNAQLASWTELRHDTILYAKPSYSGAPICRYPAGFVEPCPEFWERFQRLARGTAELIRHLTFPEGSAVLTDRSSDSSWPRSIEVSFRSIQSSQDAFLNQFASAMATLKSIAERELRQEPLSGAELGMLTNWIQTGGRIGSGVSLRKFDGSYPQLFYRSALYPVVPPDPWGSEEDMFHYNAGSAKWDALVVDVHTDPPAPVVGDPGSVLHEAVGNVDLLVLAVDNGPDRMVYGGPVLSHYEFELIGPPKRKTDSEWQSEGGAWPTNRWPPPPVWTAEYLVPGAFAYPGGWP